MQDLLALLPLIVIVLIFWLFLIRPQQRRNQQLRRLQASLEVGTRVLMASGIYGTVVRVDERKVGIEIAEGVVIDAARGAVVEVVDEGVAGGNPGGELGDRSDDGDEGPIDLGKGDR